MLQQMQTLHFLMTLLRCRKMRSADQFVSKLHKRMAKIKREEFCCKLLTGKLKKALDAHASFQDPV